MKPFIPGTRPSARKLNEAANAASQVHGFTHTGNGGGSFTGPTGMHSYDGPTWFYARITSVPDDSGSGLAGSCSGSDPCPQGYGFQSILLDECDEWIDGDLSGDGCDIRLYELNDGDAAVGTRVRVFPTADPSVYNYDAGSGGGDTITLVTCVSLFQSG